MSEPRFNEEQYRAIHAPSESDILIAAGAGSGKTKVLTERVFELVKHQNVSPSSLLVLTFTNNAAHEMKERIIARFEKDHSHLAKEMPSAHIQTFDAFSQYLVTTYAGGLGMPGSVSIADESVIEAKTREFLDQIFLERYEDPSRRDQFIEFLSHFNLKDDSITKKVILSLHSRLDGILPSERRRFLEEYDSQFLGPEKADEAVEIVVQESKTIIEQELIRAYITDQLPDEPKSLDYRNIFDNQTVIGRDIHHLSFGNQKVIQKLYQAILTVYDLDGREFLKEVSAFADKYGDICHKGAYEDKEFGEDEPNPTNKKVASILAKLFVTKDRKLDIAIEVGKHLDALDSSIGHFASDIHEILDVVRELDARLNEYKKRTNRYTFADIATLALRLVTEPEFADVAKEIRGRFKIIMVDEYQDTNDFQEAFINSLLEPDEQGKRANLFCVGDAKQSIYAFRHSKVELFRARQKQYEQSPDAEVIAMNKNYRSGEKLQKEIDYIFRHYMTPDHGGIDFLEEDEQLHYDQEANLFGEKYDSFGISRIISKTGSHSADTDFEIRAIINDIKKKIKDGFLVYDLEMPETQRVRPCMYKDFAILIRRKNSLAAFQKAFSEADIPLNMTASANLRDVDPIILIQSLIKLIASKLDGSDEDIPHLFASVARSYAYRYDDDKILNVLYPEESDLPFKALPIDIANIEADPIMRQVTAFVDGHRESSLAEIYVDLLAEFHVLDALPRVGSVADSIAKIESLYQLIAATENAGEGLNDFIEFFKSIRKYDLDFEAEDDFETDNAVDLMTIHASKGLERKVVYMPASENFLSKGNLSSRPDCVFSDHFGILLPDYVMRDANGGLRGGTIRSLPYRLEKENQKIRNTEVDEHVRLFYVALTRAANAVILVGDPTDKRTETLYHMLRTCPSSFRFEKKLEAEKLAGRADFATWRSAVRELQAAQLSLSSDDLSASRFEIYRKLFQEMYVDSLKDGVKSAFETVCIRLINEGKEALAAGNITPDQRAHYAAILNKIPAVDRASLQKYCLAHGKTGKSLDEFIENTIKGSCDLDWNQKKKPKCDYTIQDIASAVVVALLGYSYFVYETFESDEYDDRVSFADERDFSEQPKHVAPLKLAIDDTDIEFPIRIHEHASKSSAEEDLPPAEILDRGTRLHRLLELMDWKAKDTSFIEDPTDKAIIEKALQLPIFADLARANVYPEYGYYDEVLETTGYIDLLFEKDGIYTIVDYKTRHIDDAAYDNQLKTYARNVMSLFKVPASKIRLVLVSLIEARTREVKLESEVQ